eukprot:g29080.t1
MGFQASGRSERGKGGGGYPRDRDGSSFEGKGHDGKGGKSENSERYGEQKKSTVFQMQGAGGDWSQRFGNKRRETHTEEEVFGPAKTRSTSGIDFDKYDAIPVQVTGENCEDVKPIVRFSEAKLVDSLFDNLRRCGYDRPTPAGKPRICHFELMSLQHSAGMYMTPSPARTNICFPHCGKTIDSDS